MTETTSSSGLAPPSDRLTASRRSRRRASNGSRRSRSRSRIPCSSSWSDSAWRTSSVMNVEPPVAPSSRWSGVGRAEDLRAGELADVGCVLADRARLSRSGRAVRDRRECSVRRRHAARPRSSSAHQGSTDSCKPCGSSTSRSVSTSPWSAAFAGHDAPGPTRGGGAIVTRNRRIPLPDDGSHAAMYQPEMSMAHGDFYAAVGRLVVCDPVLLELVRIRCARTHDCRICKASRNLPARDRGPAGSPARAIDFYEASALPERLKVALRYTDVFLSRPGEISPDLRP